MLPAYAGMIQRYVDYRQRVSKVLPAYAGMIQEGTEPSQEGSLCSPRMRG